MKVVLLAAFSLLLSLSQAQAFLGVKAGKALNCENGSIDRMGDSHVAVTVTKHAIDIYYYESSFTLTSKVIDSVSPYITFANKKIIMTSEGDEYPITLSGSIVPFDGNKIQLYTIIDGYVSVDTLTCK